MTGYRGLVPAVVAFAILAAPVAGQPPTLESLSPPDADRSGRVLLFGSGFGSEQGDSRALVDGLAAIVTLWQPDEIHAYVPEDASLGEVEVQVVTAEGESKVLVLDVTARQPEGRVRWRFQTDRWNNRQFIEVGPDGRVYTGDARGLYALAADGALLWFVPGAGGSHAIDIGADGTIYTGVVLSEGPEIIRALNPDGSLRWEFVPPVSWDLLSGPNVGPDGNIYGSQHFVDEGGLGFFSLGPQGGLRWSNPGDPPLNGLYGPDTSASEIVFASDRLYAGVWFLRSGSPVTYAFGLGGDQIWFSGNSDLDALFHTFPRVDPQERAIGVWGQTGITALQPDGDTDWIRLHPRPNLLLIPAIDSQGNIYTGDLIGVDLWSLTPEGTTRWLGENDEILTNLGVSPDDAILVACGNDGFDAPSWVRGYAAADGALLWQVDLPREQGWPQYSSNLYPVFSADARTAYVTTAFSNVDVVDHGYLWAFDTSAGLLSLTHGPLSRGRPAAFTVTGAVAGERVDYIVSPRGTGSGPCSPALGGLCLDLLEPVTHLGSAVADGSGIARLTVAMPVTGGAAAQFLHAQAVVRRGDEGSESIKSNAVSAPIRP